jgi:zinc protease
MTMIELHWTEIDHVTTVWTDTPAPLRAGLLFRTGRADETLATAGQTHLIEHMALSAVSDTTQHHNGFVGGAVTGFFTLARPHEVSSFFARICEVLTSLPGDRLEGEKQVLAAENAARPYDFRSNLLTWRYGATGYGLVGLPELGLQGATLGQLHQYAARRFTHGNAVLWLSGPPPDDLRLRLPDGTKQPLPPLVPIQQAFPSWFVDDGCGGVAAGATVPRVDASSIFCEIASRRLRDRLRTARALSYSPSVFYDPLTPDTAHLVLYADSDKSRRAELANVFGEVFKALNTFDEAEVEASRSRILEHWTGDLAPPPADLKIIEVQRAAMDWILGKEFEPIALNATQLLSVTADDVAAFGREVQAKTMFALPGEASVRTWFGEKAPVSKARVVQGRKPLNLDAPIRREQLVHGPDGVSIIWPDGSHSTVRYSELAAALCYEDGGVRLVGSDASTVMVEPTLWRGGPSICRKIREQVPAHLLLDQRSRPAHTIPKPTTTAWQRLRARLTRH